jgi:hypothetical protein
VRDPSLRSATNKREGLRAEDATEYAASATAETGRKPSNGADFKPMAPVRGADDGLDDEVA